MRQIKPMSVSELDADLDIQLEDIPEFIDRLRSDHAKMRSALRIAFIVFAGEYAEVYDPPHTGLRTAFCTAYNLTTDECVEWGIFGE